MLQTIADSLLEWYHVHKRRLPWRESPQPYAIWVSEVMLQQTRVETVIPYFSHWMERFPTIQILSKASQQEVLMAWEGLGYYRRARNLHRSAQIVCQQYNGHLPQDGKKLTELPGIGAYTAGAIASIAFGMDEPAVDGNVRRVYSRLFNISTPMHTPEFIDRVQGIAKEQLPAGRAGEYNQALMDLGAIVCMPRSPDCRQCPLVEQCLAHKVNLQETLPVNSRLRKVPTRVVTAAIIICGEEILLAKRFKGGLLGGLWEFPGGKTLPGEDLSACLKREISEELDIEIKLIKPTGIYQHAYTHFRVVLHAFFCRPQGGRQPRPLGVEEFSWVTIPELIDYPMGKIDRQIANEISQSQELLFSGRIKR